MNLLAVDTSSELISFAAMIKGEIMVNFCRRKKYGASRVIIYLRRALDKINLSLSMFDAFVVGAGPGSFTGLRISFSIIKALSLALDKPVIAMGSFFACAAQLKNKHSLIAVIADAKRNLIYGAPFRIKSGRIVREKKEKLYQLENFVTKYKNYVFCSYNDFLREKALGFNNSLYFYSRNIWPRAKELVMLAQDYYAQSKFTSLNKLKPLYIYPDDCQIRK